jgi:hypothetical protein
MATETESVKCRVVSETPLAFQLERETEPGLAQWFPKSQIHFARRNVKTGDAEAVIPLWLLTEKGW